MEVAKKTVLVLSSVVFLVMLGIAIIIPVVPQYGLHLGADPFLVGIIVGALPAARVVLDLPAGALGDRFGNARMMRYGLATIIVSSAAAAVSLTTTMLLVARALEGVGSALYVTSSLATLAKASPPGKRGAYMGVYVNMLLVGQVVGPVVGGVVTVQWGLRAPFVAYALAAGAGLVLLVLTLPAEGAPASSRIDWGAARRLVTDRSFLVVNLGTLAAFFVRGGIIGTVIPLFILFNWGTSETEAAALSGLLITVTALASLVTMYPSGLLADRYGRKATFVTSLVLIGLIVPFVYTARDLSSAIPVMVVLGLAAGIHGPLAAWATDLAPPQAMGTAMGLYRTIGDFGFFLGPIVLGAVVVATAEDGRVSLAPFLVASVWIIATGLLLLTARDPSGERARERSEAVVDAPRIP